MRNRFLRASASSALVAFAFALPAAAQGSDDCASAASIGGLGSFPFDNTAATTGTQGQTVCDGSTGVKKDLWYVWTAPADGWIFVGTCGGVAFDSKIAVYGGAGCPLSIPIACNDDGCGVQSQVGFAVHSGDVFTLQIGSFATSSGAGSFSIAYGTAPTPCGSNTGPDVIVGDLTDVLNATASGGIDAISIGTTACNLGSASANWISSTNDHPVIRQNVYRYKVVGGAGRFEQVGMSWLKHGFVAESNNTCCTCQPTGSGSLLGVGCSDTYSASLNGSQTGLGPNWEVNAHTGVFAYPHANPPHGTDVLYRRCQIALADLEVTGGGNTTRYFGEGHYVTKDDAAAGNQNNNASWRELSVTGGPTNFGLSLAGVPFREQPAIRVWKQIDPAVNLSDVQVPGDGLLVLGSRATDLGGGTWRYEFAVYDMNADRNVGSVRVPVPVGVAVSNLGFHDVGYHDGDGPGNVNYSGTDWIGTTLAGAVVWSCETETQNPSANAIRWGTLYNFRFDAAAAPQAGAVELGLWKGGSPASVTATGAVPGGAVAASFCPGDNSVAACPCGNSGMPGRGCENSAATGGAELGAAGVPSLAGDTLVLTCTNGLPSVPGILLQGDVAIAPAKFGDGLRCAGGSLKRLYVKFASGGTTTAPQAGDPSISARSATLGDPIPAGAIRNYQLYYRDPDASFCPGPAGSTFNASNALAILWGA